MKAVEGALLREVNVQDAVGMVLPHDLTRIVPGSFKGRLFRKGHVIRVEDIPLLLDIGKEHIYAMTILDGYVHEDEAAERISRAVAGEGVRFGEPHEGKVNLKAAHHGLLKVDQAAVDEVNMIEQVVLSTLRTDVVVREGQSFAGTRVIPLVVEESKVAEVEAMTARWQKGDDASRKLLQVKPFRQLRVGLITTGSEVFKGRIADKFGPVVREKVAALGSEVIEQRLAPDDSETIVQEIRYFVEKKVDVILLTGGMSVDPDDRTPGAIKQTGARIVSYGTPMLPGSMLMMAYLGDIPVMGLPGCVMHDPYTSFDILLPRVCAGELITRQDIVTMGYGGFHSC